MILSFFWLGQALSMKTKIDFPIFQEWGDALESVWPDITIEEKASWTDVGLTFKMRRRYRKFLLLYYVPRSSSLFLDPTIASKYFQPFLRCLFLGVILDNPSGKAIPKSYMFGCLVNARPILAHNGASKESRIHIGRLVGPTKNG